MRKINFTDKNGTFTITNPENYSGLYLPLAGEEGLKSSITPTLGGDSKTDQNHFLLEPVSIENLHNNRGTRNFWCRVEGKGYWSACGVSAEQEFDKYTDRQDESTLEAGMMWQKLTRTSKKYHLQSEITSFVSIDGTTEIQLIKITNLSEEEQEVTPIVAIPVYGRSADNIRDHRHVTSLLHRIDTKECGVEVTPVLSFDERGHQKNDTTYFVYGFTAEGNAPKEFYPTVESFIGEGGSFLIPEAVRVEKKGCTAGCHLEGKEAVGAFRFERRKLKANESIEYVVLAGATGEKASISKICTLFGTKEQAENELAKVKKYWTEKVNVEFETGDEATDNYLKWICFQPILRRIYGCSFLPYHDYGKGGRGWRDLWQDCLALLLMNPDGVREMLLNNFQGVRIDGTNATIIGSKEGTFIADRNQITRVWMDHGVWPFVTTKLYIDQTGDLAVLEEEIPYFKDQQAGRGTKKDAAWKEQDGCWQRDAAGNVYRGSVLEHLLLQNLTAFYEVGEHGHIRLRGADWNDALDMAGERGESVAFTNAYAGNLRELAELLALYAEKTGKESVPLNRDLFVLLADDDTLYASVQKKQELLTRYTDACIHEVSGQKTEVSITELVRSLQKKAAFLTGHIRATEWVTDEEGNGWFNGYYDNHGRCVEGVFAQGVRMMLTSQVFAVMAQTATDEQVAEIVRSADKYLYCDAMGGYRLNTDFGEVKMDLGRMFGFAYGEKENGAVFSHMAVMFANALYKRGFVKEGHRALNALYRQSVHFETSRIYPGIPEYFNSRGKGMYHYLTGAASWYMLTVITEMFGAKGCAGNLMLEPKLERQQFDLDERAELFFSFAGQSLHLVYENKEHKEYGAYRPGTIRIDGELWDYSGGEKETRSVCIDRERLKQLDFDVTHEILVELV